MNRFTELPFLGRAADQFHQQIRSQTEAVFEKVGIVIPVRSCSLVLALKDLGLASAADLAKDLGCSHQLVLQKIPKLRKLHLVSVEQDPNDARRRIFELTGEGQTQVEKLQEVLPSFVTAYEELFDQVGDTLTAINTASAALETRTLAQRIAESEQT